MPSKPTVPRPAVPVSDAEPADRSLAEPLTAASARPRAGADRAAPLDADRRRFLRGGAALGIAAALPSASLVGCGNSAGEASVGASTGSAAEPSSVGVAATSDTGQRPFGQTGFTIPSVSFGTFSLRTGPAEEQLVRRALEAGVTHFDTADGYGDAPGEAETTLGRALRSASALGQQATITTKTAAPAGATAAELMETLDGSLRRLQRETIDLYLNHAVDSFDRLRNPAWPEFIARAKAAGKIRAAGMSGHGPSLVPVLREAIETEWIDAILVAYNYIQTPSFLSQAKIKLQAITGRLDWVALQPELPEVLAAAQRKGLGVMTMKTLRGARHNDLRPFERDGSTFAQAAIRWVLAQPNVDGLVITMKSEAQVGEYLAAAQVTRRPEDLALLVGYEALNHTRQCVQGCSDCANLCPAGVPISDTLRLSMYARDYGEPERAASEYAALGARAAACADCSGAPCLGACPTGLLLPEEMKAAHRRLQRGPRSRDSQA